jgi:hypothetical protein
MTKPAGRPRGYIADYRPHEATKQLLGDVMAVLEEYREHWPLTNRQVFYRLIGAYGYEKSDGFYERLCQHVGNARRARVLPFDAIRDDGVTTYDMDHFPSMDAFLADMRSKAEGYQRDLMADQAMHAEIWCESAGMLQQLARVGKRFSIRVYSCSGFDSLTSKKNLADRICTTGKPAIILHLGDYDPDGEAIFKAVAEDVREFVMADRQHGFVDVEFRRVGLTREQVAEYKLPTAPTKPSNTRSRGWQGGTCQLEALAPDQIANLLEVEIARIVDIELMEQTLRLEKTEREDLTRLLLPDFTAGRNNGEAAQ